MMGRPPKPDDERRANVLRIRLTEEERAVLDRAAAKRSDQESPETSTWARDVLLREAKATR